MLGNLIRCYEVELHLVWGAQTQDGLVSGEAAVGYDKAIVIGT